MDYEQLSESAKQGLENFRKAFPHFREEREQSRYYCTLRSIVVGFCIAAGSTYEEGVDASRFASSKKFWL